MSKSNNKAFLLIRLKKYMNPHENSCLKVKSKLTTGNIYHESSSAPGKNTNRYNINGLLCTYTEMFRILTCCKHILSAAEGFRGRRQHSQIQEFLSVLFNPQLSLQFTEGVQWFYCLENYTYTLPRIQTEGPLFSRGGGVQLFPGGGGGFKC